MFTINKYYVDDQEKWNVVLYQHTFIIYILSAQHGPWHVASTQ